MDRPSQLTIAAYHSVRVGRGRRSAEGYIDLPTAALPLKPVLHVPVHFGFVVSVKLRTQLTVTWPAVSGVVISLPPAGKRTKKDGNRNEDEKRRE